MAGALSSYQRCKEMVDLVTLDIVKQIESFTIISKNTPYTVLFLFACTDCAVARCVSVRLFVCHTLVLCCNGEAYHLTFSPSGSDTKPYHSRNASRKPQPSFSAVPVSIALNDPKPTFQRHAIFDADYLRNGTTYIHSFKEILIGTVEFISNRL